MDGVLQSPSGAGEDTRNGFKWGGWSRHYWDEMMGNECSKLMSTRFDLLLGRWTYEVFKAYRPHQQGAVGTESLVSTTGAVFTTYVLDGEVRLDPVLSKRET